MLRDVDANASNSIVSGVHDGANFFAGAFTDLDQVQRSPEAGDHDRLGASALLVYLLVGALIARLIGGVGRGGVGFERRHRAAPTH